MIWRLSLEKNNYIPYIIIKLNYFMKKILGFLIFIFSISIFANQKYEFEMNGSFKETTKLLPDKSSFSSINTFGAFSDNQGNIGKYECDGIREAHENGKLINLNVLCEINDKDYDKFWMKAERDTDKSGGVGTYHIIEGIGKYKEVIGKKCTYAITFFDEIVFIKAIC